MKRIAIIALIVSDREAAEAINGLLHEYGEHIVGRMGVPCRERGINLISVAMDAEQDVISALAGKLGRLPGVSSKTVYAPEEH
ncbi:MAG: iron-only hydrogenase system regulator [Oscillospiraceae bacterium]|nr:iron-only hydrogenase system regulator [Oscillospiraceae bacterium]MBR6678058.1 iron-only hydrogenase system regulator [Oscillospiraceae bacterium]